MMPDHVAEEIRELRNRCENLERRNREHDDRFDKERDRTEGKFERARRRTDVALAVGVVSLLPVVGILIYLSVQ